MEVLTNCSGNDFTIKKCIEQYVCTLNLRYAICQLYPDKAGGK